MSLDDILGAGQLIEMHYWRWGDSSSNNLMAIGERGGRIAYVRGFGEPPKYRDSHRCDERFHV